MWHLGSLTTNLAEKKDTNGAFCLVEGTLAPGSEPPPHVHSREDELFYVLEGEFNMYVGKEAFKVEAGMRVSPQIQPARICYPLALASRPRSLQSRRLEEAFRSIDSPAQSLELPTAPLTNSRTPQSLARNQAVESRAFEANCATTRSYGARFLTPA